MLLQENVPLASLTTMRLGGPARYVIDLKSEHDCVEAFDFAENRELPVYFLGLGANSLGRDSGFPGVIVRNKISSLELIQANSSALVLRAGGGILWDDLVAAVSSRGYTGCEALSGIPSTVGAAPVQNIGAYGQELKDTLLSCEVYDSLLNEFTDIDAADLDFSYRRSLFNSGETKGRYFILYCKFRFEKGSIAEPLYASLADYLDSKKITDRSPNTIRQAVLAIRNSKLPDPAKIPSSGSFFKNIYLSSESEARRLQSLGIPVRQSSELPRPARGRDDLLSQPLDPAHPAAKPEEADLDEPTVSYKVNTAALFEALDLKGRQFHGFELYPSAPLVLVNRSATSAHDLELAKAEISALVWNKFKLELEQEPVYIEESSL